MSVWSNIQNRSCGESITQEDFSRVYTGDDKDSELRVSRYKDFDYTIYTNGSYPYIKITSDKNSTLFKGAQLVKLSDERRTYDLERVAELNTVGYTYFCNEEGDYIEGQQDGKRYSVANLENLSKKFIDIIIECEKRYPAIWK